jgi:CO dehydrogenase maturation factor
VIESERFDLIAMGRSEGPGCYCAVNHNLREIIDSLSRSYRYVVIDNEAGMEHLSRRTTRDVDHLYVVSDPTQRGIVAAERIANLKNELDIDIKNAYLILNRSPETLPEMLLERIEQIQLPFLGQVPADQQVMEFDFEGRPLVTLDNSSPVYQAVESMLDETLNL